MHAYRTHTCGELRMEAVGSAYGYQAGCTADATMAASIHRSAGPLRHDPVRHRA